MATLTIFIAPYFCSMHTTCSHWPDMHFCCCLSYTLMLNHLNSTYLPLPQISFPAHCKYSTGTNPVERLPLCAYIFVVLYSTTDIDHCIVVNEQTSCILIVTYYVNNVKPLLAGLPTMQGISLYLCTWQQKQTKNKSVSMVNLYCRVYYNDLRGKESEQQGKPHSPP